MIHTEVEADYGREEERICRVYRDLSFISAGWNWPKLSALVEVERRSHWIVENGLHCTLDVEFDEGRSRKRVGNAAQNYSRLMSLLKRDRQRTGFDKLLRRYRKLAAWNT